MAAATSLPGSGRGVALAMVVALIGSGCAAPRPEVGRSEMFEPSATPLHPGQATQAGWETLEWWREFEDPVLDHLIARALEDQPVLQVARLRIERAQAIEREAASLLFPDVALGARLARTQPFDVGVRPPGVERPTVDAARLTLDFSHEFDFWNRHRALLRAAGNELSAIEAEAQQARNVLCAAVSAAYFQLRAALRHAQIAHAVLDAKRTSLELHQDREEAGLDALIHVHQAHTEMERARMDAVRADHRAQLMRHQLAALLGREPGSLAALQLGPDHAQATIAIPQVLPADLLGRRPDVVASRARVEAAARAVDIARADFLPNVNLFALIGLDAIRPVDFFSEANRTWSVGAALRLPLFDGGRLNARLDARTAEYDIAVEVYNSTVLTAMREAADALAGFISSTDDVSAAMQATQAAEQVYASLLERHINGLTNMSAVLIAETAVLAHETALVQAREQQLLSMVQTFKALGGGYQAPPDTSRQ